MVEDKTVTPLSVTDPRVRGSRAHSGPLGPTDGRTGTRGPCTDTGHLERVATHHTTERKKKKKGRRGSEGKGPLTVVHGRSLTLGLGPYSFDSRPPVKSTVPLDKTGCKIGLGFGPGERTDRRVSGTEET